MFKLRNKRIRLNFNVKFSYFFQALNNGECANRRWIGHILKKTIDYWFVCEKCRCDRLNILLKDKNDRHCHLDGVCFWNFTWIMCIQLCAATFISSHIHIAIILIVQFEKVTKLTPKFFICCKKIKQENAETIGWLVAHTHTHTRVLFDKTKIGKQ